MPRTIDSFDWNRLLLLGRNIVLEDQRILFVSLAAWGAAWAILELIIGYGLGLHAIAVEALYPCALFAGFFHTSNAFNALHDKLEAPRYLMLPASTAEKLAARWLMTGIGYPLLVAVIGTALYQITYHIGWHPSPDLHVSVNGSNMPLQAPGWTLLPVGGVGLLVTYLVIQSVFFFGAVRFPKYPFAMTALVFCPMAVLYLLGHALLHHLAVIAADADGTMHTFRNTLEFLDSWLPTFLWVLLPPFFIWQAYRHLRDAEA